MIRNLFHNAFREKQALGTSKPTECSVGYRIGLANATPNIDIRKVVNVVNMRQTSVYNSGGEILRITTVGKDIRVKCKKLSFFGHSNFPLTEKWMPLTRDGNIFIAVEHASDWSSGFCSCCGAYTSEQDGARFFTAESTTKSLDSRNDFIFSNAGDLSNVCLSMRLLDCFDCKSWA